MKIISYLEAMVSLITPINLWRPDEGFPSAGLFNGIVARYGFQIYGFGEATAMPAFQAGQFVYEGRQITINSLEFQQGGVTANGTKTDSLELFLKDLVECLESEFGFKKDAKFKKTFRSTLLTEHSFEVDDIFGKWADFALFINENLSAPGRNQVVKPSGLKYLFWEGDRLVGDRQVIIERRIGPEGGPGRVFSVVPASNQDHIKVLERYEEIFAPRGD